MNAIEIEYELNGDAPYYWDTETNWSGGALPASTDMVTINNAALKTSPLIVKSGTSAVASNLVADVGTIIVEQNAALTARKGNAGGITLAKTANAVGVVTNNGTVTAYNLDFGGKTAAELARFDNFGTLNVVNAMRLQLDGGAPSIFYNHAGATLRKTGGNEYSFYLGHGATSGGYSMLVNEGDIFDNTTEIWAGLHSLAKCDIVINQSGRFFTEKSIVLGCVSGTLCVLTLNDNGYCSGNAQWVLGGRTKAAKNTNAEGRIILNDFSILAASNTVYAGYGENGRGIIALNDSSKMTSTKAVYLGYGESATGTLAMGGQGSFTTSANLNIGYGADATGSLTLTNSSTAEVKGHAYMGLSAGATGNMTLSDSAAVRIRKDFHVGYHADSVGNVALTNSAVLDIEGQVFVGDNSTASGNISLAGDSRMYATNVAMLVGYNGGATGTVTITENAQLHAPWLAIGQTSIANTTGYVKLFDNAVLVATNICIPRWGSQGWGTLEVGGNSVVTNMHILRVAHDANVTAGVGQSGTVAMRGGSMFFDVDPETDVYKKQGYYNPIALNGYRTQVKGRIRGWGKIAFSDPRTYVTEADIPCGLTHYGQVIADGEGVMRDLDFSRFGALQYSSTDANPSGTNGWFAVNKGRLKLPRSLPNRSGYKCVGDCYNASVELGAGARRLANTFNYEFTGAALNNFVFSELYAVDRDDIPAGLDGLDADKVIAVWRIGYFSDGPEIDDPEHPVPFTTAKLKFKYSPLGLDGLNFVHVYRHDGTSGGEWKRCGRIVAPDTAMPVVSTRAFTPSSANWNLGWFAIVGRVERPAASIIHIR